MSYDIRFGVWVAGTDKIVPFAKPEYDSPTYNISEMLRKAMAWDFEQGKWYRLDDVYSNLRRGYAELTTKEYLYKKYNSPNGWGNTRTVVEVLQSIDEKIDEIMDFYGLKLEQFYIKF